MDFMIIINTLLLTELSLGNDLLVVCFIKGLEKTEAANGTYMLSIRECKIILCEEAQEFSDEEIEELRSFCYELSKLMIDNAKKQKTE
jgi:hypothetical protein